MILHLSSLRETLKNTNFSGFGRSSTNMVLKCLGFFMFVVTTLSMVFLFHWYINKSNADLVRISSPTEYTTITVTNEPFMNPKAEELKMDPAIRTFAKRSIPDLNIKNKTDGINQKVDAANLTLQSFTSPASDSREIQPEISLNTERNDELGSKSNDKNGTSQSTSEPSKNCTSEDPECISPVSRIMKSKKNKDLNQIKIIRTEKHLANKSETNENSNTEEHEKLELHLDGKDETTKYKRQRLTLNDTKTSVPSDLNAIEESIKLETENCTIDWNYIQQIEDYLKKYEHIKQLIDQDKIDLTTPGKRDATVKKDRAMLLLQEQLVLDDIEKNLTALLSKGNFGESLNNGEGEFYPSTEISLPRTLEGTTNNDPLNIPTASTDVNNNSSSVAFNFENKMEKPENISHDKNLQSNRTDWVSSAIKEDKPIIPKANIDLRPIEQITKKDTNDHLGSKPALKEPEYNKNNTQNLLGNRTSGTELLDKRINTKNPNGSLENQTTLVVDADFNVTHPTEIADENNIQNEKSDSTFNNDTFEDEADLKSKNSTKFLKVYSGNSEDENLATLQSSINLDSSGVKDETSLIEKDTIGNLTSFNEQHNKPVEKSNSNKDIIQQNKTDSFVVTGDTLSESENTDNIRKVVDVGALGKVAEMKLENPNKTTSFYKKREISPKVSLNRTTHIENFIIPRNSSLHFESSSVTPLRVTLQDQMIPSGSKPKSDGMDPLNKTEELGNKSTEIKAVENFDHASTNQFIAKENRKNAGEEKVIDHQEKTAKNFEFYEINNDYEDIQNYDPPENYTKSHLLFNTIPRVSVPSAELPTSNIYENNLNTDMFEKEPIKSKLTALIDRIIFQRENIKNQIDESERISNNGPSSEEDEDGEENRKVPCENIPASKNNEDEEYETMIRNLHDVHFNDEQEDRIQKRKTQFKRENIKEKRKIKTMKQYPVEEEVEVTEDEDLEKESDQLQVASNKLEKRKAQLLSLKNKIKLKDEESNQDEDDGSEEIEDTKILNLILGKKMKPKTIVPPSVYKKPTKLAKPVKPDVKSVLNKYKKPAKASKYAEKSEKDFSEEELNENGLPDIVYIPFKNTNDLDVKSLLLLSNALSKGDQSQNHLENPQQQESVYSRGYNEHQLRLPETGRLPTQYESDVRRSSYSREPTQYGNTDDVRMQYSRDPAQYSNEPEYHQYDQDENLPERSAWLRKRKINIGDGQGVSQRRSFLNLEEPTREIANLIKSIQQISSQFKKS